MTYEEALERNRRALKNTCDRCFEKDSCDDCCEKNYYVIIDTALEKQILKKPLIKNPSAALPTMIFKCPACKCELDDTAPNSYCPDCGQAIDWTEV